MDAHDTHCCIDPSHGCKYSDDDCPVANGIRKQVGLCEFCGRETERDFPVPSTADDRENLRRMRGDQQEYLDALWEEKHNPRKLTTLEQAVAEIAKRHGRARTIAILREVSALPLGYIDTQVYNVLSILDSLKGIK